MATQATLTFLPPPKNQCAMLLRDLLTGKEISEAQYTMNGFCSRIHDLIQDYGVPIQYQEKQGVNSFGRKYTYRVHYLFLIDIPEAEKIYQKVNK